MYQCEGGLAVGGAKNEVKGLFDGGFLMPVEEKAGKNRYLCGGFANREEYYD